MRDSGIEAENRLNGGAVDSARRLVGMVVREVRADHEKRLVATPEVFQHFGDLLRRHASHHERHEREFAEHLLQERELHFQSVLLRVRRSRLDDLGQAADRGYRFFVERDPAKRRVESARCGERETAHGDTVAGTENHRSPDDAARRAQQVIGARRDRPGIDVTGVRDDHRLGKSRGERRVLRLLEI